MNIWNYSDPLFGFFFWFFFHVLKLSPFDIGQTELIGLSLIQSSLINGHFTVHWFPMDYLPLDQLTTNYLLSLWPAVNANKGTTCAVYWIHVTCWQTGNHQVFTELRCEKVSGKVISGNSSPLLYTQLYRLPCHLSPPVFLSVTPSSLISLFSHSYFIFFTLSSTCPCSFFLSFYSSLSSLSLINMCIFLL